MLDDSTAYYPSNAIQEQIWNFHFQNGTILLLLTLPAFKKEELPERRFHKASTSSMFLTILCINLVCERITVLKNYLETQLPVSTSQINMMCQNDMFIHNRRF